MKMLTQERALTKTSNIHHLSNYSIVVLLLGLAVWIWVPIVGIFPLLLSVQLNLLKSDKLSKKIVFLNNLVLILVVFTISVFLSSYTVVSDTVTYVQEYQQLDKLSPFDLARGNGFEFVSLLLVYPVYYLTNGSVYAFLFTQALIINTLVVFVISKGLSKKYYPVLLMIVCSSSTGTFSYYSQMLFMRHFLSNIFLMSAVATIESRVSFWIYSFLSFFSHLSNLFYVFILIFIKFISQINAAINRFLKIRKTKKKYILAIIFIFVLLLSFLYFNLNLKDPIRFFIEQLKVVGLTDISNYLGDRSASYSDYSKDDYEMSRNQFFRAYIFTGVGFLLYFWKNNISVKFSALLSFLILQLLSYSIVLSTGFNSRIILLITSMYGFFYTGMIESKIKIIKIFLGIIVTYNVVSFLKQASREFAPLLTFFNGQPLQMTLFDYIEFFIKATPN
jgi:hypothetical protein